jgi:hypothetical protein
MSIHYVDLALDPTESHLKSTAGMPKRSRMVGRRSANDQWCCGQCGLGFNNLGKHYRYHPACREAHQREANRIERAKMAECFAQSQEAAAAQNQDAAPARFRSSSILAHQMACEELKYGVAWDLLDLRHQHGLRDGQVDLVKKFVTKWNSERDQMSHGVLAEFLQPGITPAEVTAALSRLPLFAGLETNK